MAVPPSRLGSSLGSHLCEGAGNAVASRRGQRSIDSWAVKQAKCTRELYHLRETRGVHDCACETTGSAAESHMTGVSVGRAVACCKH